MLGRDRSEMNKCTNELKNLHRKASDMKKMFASLLMVLGVSAAVCAAEVSEIAEKALAHKDARGAGIRISEN